jgi:alpha-tubulin suppressor-like RCC1 family protein
VLADTTVWCWGLDGDGQASPGATSDPALATAVTTDGSTALTGVVEVSTGGRHTCARLRTGQVRCWGFNGTGQLGDGSVVTPTSPVAVKADAVTSLTGVVELAAGGNHTCARLATGAVMCWGRGSEGQLGSGGLPLYEIYPNLVLVDAGGSIAGATAIAAGYNHSCAVWGDDARASCWGANFFGQLGDGSTDTATSAVTFTAAGGAPVLGAVDVAAGLNHTCVVVQTGTMGCAGSAAFGQLGAGSVSSGQSERGVAVALAAGVRAAAVTAEGDQSCIVDRTGRPWCWGRNATGGVGDGSTDQRNSPVRPVGL